MTLASLSQVLAPCLADGTAVAGLVVLGWEDAMAYVRAAETLQRPVILQAGPGCRAPYALAGDGGDVSQFGKDGFGASSGTP